MSKGLASTKKRRTMLNGVIHRRVAVEHNAVIVRHVSGNMIQLVLNECRVLVNVDDNEQQYFFTGGWTLQSSKRSPVMARESIAKLLP